MAILLKDIVFSVVVAKKHFLFDTEPAADRLGEVSVFCEVGPFVINICSIEKMYFWVNILMLPNTPDEVRKAKFLETARAAYPGGMSMYGKGIVRAGNKQAVSLFFTSENFFVPRINSFRQDHETICEHLSKKILFNRNRKALKKETVAAKFLDTFLYQLMKFEEYRKLWPKLHLIIDTRILKRLKACGDEKLIVFLNSFPESPYEADYSKYLELQHAIEQFLIRKKSKFFKNKIDLNFLWAQ